MKTKCEYCKGYTKDDKSGNCSACGAPRQEKESFYIPTESTYGSIVNPTFPKSQVRVNISSSTNYEDFFIISST